MPATTRRPLGWRALLQSHGFVIAMAGAVMLAFAVPFLGRSGGLLQLDRFTTLGVTLIFFLHGLRLSPQAIYTGISNWPLHLLVQGITFIAYPLLWLLLGSGLRAIMPEALALGFCYLLVLPGTLSSSVTMTSLAGGNVPGALFNAALSSVLGVVLTPLWVLLLIGRGGEDMAILAPLQAIASLLLLPMVAGQLLRPVLAQFLHPKAITHTLDQGVILLIVFNAFSDSVASGVWGRFQLSTLVLALTAALVILLAVVQGVRGLVRILGFSRQDEMAALFCASKKSLAAGVPMASVLFKGEPMLGMLLLPIMLYHPMQIFYCALLARRYRGATP